MPFELPPKSAVGYLDPEIAGEGQKVILSDGEQVSWTPPPPRPVMPDWSQIKSIARYFNRQGYIVYPAWLYHPSEEPRLVKNADEAAALGVCYRKATVDERGRYGLDSVWDWQDGSKWRPKPFGPAAFDPNKPGTGKTYMPSAPSPGAAQHQLLEALIPAVAAAVAQSLKATGPAAPANVAPAEWDEFLQFKAWQKSREAVDVLSQETAPGNAPGSEEDRAPWQAEAERKGITVDPVWSLDQLKAEIAKAA